ncbi:MAG: oligosaccharide flippase family protein [Candidatus Dormibacteraeota bacterium]|uniref:Oligosaccharide flippase family protein n=1 Tax=Candidatus Aeolococcus gillhamiae TaxID=3127015 RepID=A0A934K007_9BACT|nr:oligosaccharide flippase family protein [Candidatus Dormibacteraeota bacterium]
MSTVFARRAARGTVWTAAATWLNRLFVLVVVLVLARNLDARQFGVLGVATLAANVALQLNEGGMIDALIWWPGRQDRDAAETTLLSLMVLGAVLGGLLVALAPAIATVFSAPDALPLLRVYGIVIFVDATGSAYIGMLTRELDFRRRFFPDVLPSVCGSLLTVGLALGGVGIWSLVIGDLVTGILRMLVGFVVVGRHTVPRWHAALAAKLMRFGRAALASTFLEFALQNIDYALVALLLGPVALGLYTIAFRVAILPFLVVTWVIAGVAFPLYARVINDRPAVQRVLELTMRVCGSLVVLMGVGVATLAPSLELLGQRWAPSVPVARWLGIYICIRSAAFTASSLLRVVNPRVNALLKGAWVVLLAVLIATVGRNGITTVGAIQVVVAIPLLAAYLLLVRRLAGVSIWPVILDMARIAFAAAVAAAATLALRHAVAPLADPTSLGALVVLGIVFCATYALALALILPGVASDVRGLRELAGKKNETAARALAAESVP